MSKKLFHTGTTGFILGAAFVTTLTGCVGYVDGPRGAVYAAPPVVEVAPPVIVEQDDFIYYPQYGMYYGSRSHRYYYQDGRSWVARPAPRGVSVNVLFASPSVSVGFHDHLETHHAEVIRAYPKNWRPDGGNHERRDDHRDDHRDDNKR
jgi:hypothetical protein